MAIVGGLLGNLLSKAAQFNRPASLTNPSPQQQQAVQTFQAARSSPVYGPYAAAAPAVLAASTATSAARPVAGPTRPTAVAGPPSPVNSGGGGGGGGQVQQNSFQQSAPQDSGQQSYYEQTPGAPQIDFDSLIAPALEALNATESALNTGGQTDISSIESGAQTQRTNLGTSRTAAENQLTSRRAETLSAGENAINESRRAAAELQQGLASRFGAGSSTGLGASAILGAQAARTIGQQRSQLSEALNQVEIAKTGIMETYNNALKEVDAQTETSKAQSRSNLQTNLAQIGQQRATLQSRKAELVYSAMEQYRQEVNAVNQRNTQFKQQLELQAQAAQQKLTQIETVAKNRVGSLKTPNYSVVSNPLTGEQSVFNPVSGTGSPYSPTGSITPSKASRNVGIGTLNPEDQQFLDLYNQN